MSNLVRKSAPDFTADAVFPDGTIKPFTLSGCRGKYAVLFFYPMDFTFVCPSEILAFDRKEEDFSKRNCMLIGISTDSVYTHSAWRSVKPGNGGIGSIHYPLVSDITKNISRSYGVLCDEAMAFRALFLIDKEGIIRHELVNDLSFGRNVFEAIRMLNALQFYEQYGEVCPANWSPGDKAIKSTPEGVAEYLRESYPEK